MADLPGLLGAGPQARPPQGMPGAQGGQGAPMPTPEQIMQAGMIALGLIPPPGAGNGGQMPGPGMNAPMGGPMGGAQPPMSQGLGQLGGMMGRR